MKYVKNYKIIKEKLSTLKLAPCSYEYKKVLDENENHSSEHTTPLDMYIFLS
jgi:hypothetical protein